MSKNYMFRWLLVFLLTALCVSTGFSQSGITVKGKVTDGQNNPLIGVAVVVRNAGTPIGQTTDVNGNYQISIPPPYENAALEVSYIGYETVTEVVGSRTEINFVLQDQSVVVDDVVVIGYGVQQKSHLTGSISKLGGDAVASINVSDVGTALQGQIAGVTINNTTSEVGVSPEITVRGIGSISAASSPLIVVDGFPSAMELSDLNANDIQSIEVLKDAASAAIYGSRAANGVIMVTTKSGVPDKPRYSVKMYTGLKYYYKLHDLMNSQQYVDLLNWEQTVGQGDGAGAQARAGLWLEQNFGYTDWQREGLRDPATTSNIQFSVQGGKKDIRYYTSAAYTYDEGIMLQNKVNKINFRTKLDADLSKAVKMGTNVSVSYSDTKRPRNNFINFYRTPSFLPVYHNDLSTALTGYTGFAHGAHFNQISLPTGNPDDLGNPTWQTSSPFGSSNTNPRSVMATSIRGSETFNTNANVYLTIDIIKGLQFKTSNGVTLRHSPEYSYYEQGSNTPDEPSSASYFSRLVVDMLTENTLTYTTKIKKHDINALLGYTAQKTRNEVVSLTASGFPTDNIKTLNAATVFEIADKNNAMSNRNGTGTYRYPDVGLESFLGRISYAYDDKYLLSASLRLDRSSLFDKGNRDAWFPSVSLGWRISEEDFMRPLHWLSQLKLRASYGVTGNNRVDYYASYPVYSNSNYSLGTGKGGLVSGLANVSSTLSNPSITWEQTDEFNFGLDAGFLQNRVQLTLDAYYSVTRALLFEQGNQSFTGFNKYWNNIGKIRNTGFELQVDATPISNKNFQWTSTLNFALTRNKILELGGEYQMITMGERDEEYIARVGHPLVQYFGYKSIGVWNSQAEIDDPKNASFTTGVDKPGGLRIWDSNGDGVIDANDRVPLGNPYPDFTWGFTNTFRYKNFDLSILVQGVQGITVFNGDVFYNETHKWNWKYVKNRWTSESAPGDGKTPYGKTGIDPIFTDYPLENASYLCLRNLTIGYTFDKKLLEKVKLQGVRVYVSGNNLLYLWSDNYRGVNPESRFDSGVYSGPLTSGYQRGGFPLTSTITFGLDFNF